MRPQAGEFPVFYNTYISLVTGNDIRIVLSESLKNLEDFLYTIPADQSEFAYAKGKWTVKEVLQHCIDTERIFAFRALCHARGEQQSLPGFEQDDYAAAAPTSHRMLGILTEELIMVRRSTLLLFDSFTTAGLNRTGIVNGNPIKTFSWAFIIAGHWLHHERILKEKYNL